MMMPEDKEYERMALVGAPNLPLWAGSALTWEWDTNTRIGQ